MGHHTGASSEPVLSRNAGSVYRYCPPPEYVDMEQRLLVGDLLITVQSSSCNTAHTDMHQVRVLP